jgi:ribosomal protein S18 acetylase RimI-like enzyme
MPFPVDLIRLWRAMDLTVGSVEPTWWGAVVTSSRFPSIWDVNYARVDEPADPTLREIEEAMRATLERAGAKWLHVVCLRPADAPRLVAELSTRSPLTWDVVMRHEGTDPEIDAAIEELPPGPELWEAVSRSNRIFGVEEPGASQLLEMERDVLAPAGWRRWFAVRDAGRVAAVAALVELEGVGYVDNVATAPEARRRGYASALTARCVREAREGGAGSVYLLVDPGGPVSLYERLGFREVGRIPSIRVPLAPPSRTRTRTAARGGTRGPHRTAT